MALSVGYKQSQRHFNVEPKVTAEISTLSEIGTSRYNPDLPKVDNVQAFLKYPIRYFFNVTVKQPKLATSFQHSYYYDNKKDAEKCHKKLLARLYDQKTKKYLDKLEKGKELTYKEQQELLSTIDKVQHLRF